MTLSDHVHITAMSSQQPSAPLYHMKQQFEPIQMQVQIRVYLCPIITIIPFLINLQSFSEISYRILYFKYN